MNWELLFSKPHEIFSMHDLPAIWNSMPCPASILYTGTLPMRRLRLPYLSIWHICIFYWALNSSSYLILLYIYPCIISQLFTECFLQATHFFSWCQVAAANTSDQRPCPWGYGLQCPAHLFPVLLRHTAVRWRDCPAWEDGPQVFRPNRGVWGEVWV